MSPSKALPLSAPDPPLILRNNQQHEATSSNNCPIPFFNLRVAIGRVLFPHTIGFRTRQIGFNTYLKSGRRIEAAEAEAMRYVANNTSIPVPKVKACWSAEGVTYIAMNVIGGTELHLAWHDMSHMMKRRVVDQLRNYLAQLRALKPPVDGAVTSVTGGVLRDASRVGFDPFGPFQNHEDFHEF